MIALSGNALLIRGLKAIFHRERPEYEHGLFVASGFSFPSGHASGATVAYGMLSYLLIRMTPAPWHLPILMMSSAVILLTGFSRVFLQVHFFSDVIAGFCAGAAWLAVCITGTEIARRHADRTLFSSRMTTSS